MSRRAIFVTQAYPPVAGSHAARAVAMAKALEERLPTVVLTIEVGEDYPQRSVPEAMPPVQLVRTYPGVAHRFAHGRTARVEAESPRPAWSQQLKGALGKAVMASYRRVTVIDSYFDWIPHLAASTRSELRPEDLVVSTSMPNSVHVATLFSLRGKKNRWIADFGDPWTLDKSAPTQGLRRWLEAKFERAVVSRADALLFTTQATKRDYAATYPNAASKMHVMRMAYDSADAAIGPCTLAPRSLFYGGSLPSNNRSASELLKVAVERTDATFVFAGACVAQVRAHYDRVPANVKLIEWLDHHDFVGHLKGASASIVFGNSNPQQVPGKVYQYSAFAPRVLYIRGMDPAVDEGLALLDGSVMACDNERSAIDRAIDELLELPPAALPRDPGLEWGAAVSVLSRLVEASPDRDAII